VTEVLGALGESSDPIHLALGDEIAEVLGVAAVRLEQLVLRDSTLAGCLRHDRLPLVVPGWQGLDSIAGYALA